MARCTWSALPVRERGPLLHAIRGSLWLTVQQERWEWEKRHAARVTLDLYLHDGTRWEQVPGGARSTTVDLDAGETLRWELLLEEILERLSIARDDLWAGRIDTGQVVEDLFRQRR